MYLEDLNCFNNKALIKKFYKESQGKEAMSAKNIRHWLQQNLSDNKKHYPVVVVIGKDIFDKFLKGCDFECDSWRGSYCYPAARLSDTIYDVETVIENLKKMSGKDVVGYKGGNFVLDEEDEIYLVSTFSCGGDNTAVVDIKVIDGVVYMVTSDDMY